jgi:hypothetical protein
MVERLEKVKVVLLDGPFDAQDIYVDQAAIADKAILVMGETYDLVEGCNTCSEAFCFRWRGDRSKRLAQVSHYKNSASE